MNIANLFFLFAVSPDAAGAAARDDPQLGRDRGLRRMKVHACLPALAQWLPLPQNETAALNSARMKPPGFGSFGIADEASEPSRRSRRSPGPASRRAPC